MFETMLSAPKTETETCLLSLPLASYLSEVQVNGQLSEQEKAWHILRTVTFPFIEFSSDPELVYSGYSKKKVPLTDGVPAWKPNLLQSPVKTSAGASHHRRCVAYLYSHMETPSRVPIPRSYLSKLPKPQIWHCSSMEHPFSSLQLHKTLQIQPLHLRERPCAK